ncbi:DNA polymerase III catalytic subunit, PolC type [Natronincola peptidivorans]|uniref:DNA polymerase III PolC-type n=1 Tax=Natronincola peptidivorans TaxID=426128 RepID=A0A1H9YHA7_9FIRM|nr:PolC-type DNA polymerase III [Natronincola peptidivorans]SES68404.1 DNA polymerase III catalytic subunit, PolC type [Natronincola peptidivorans]
MDPLNKQMRIKDFAKELGLTPVASLQNTTVEGVKLYKKSKKIAVCIKASSIVDEEELQYFIKELKSNINIVKDIEVSINYELQYKSLEDLITNAWHNILFLLKREMPAVKAVAEKVTWEIVNSKLSLKVDEAMIFQKAKERKIDKTIEKYFADQFKCTMRCVITSSNRPIFDLSTYEKQKQEENNIFADKIKKETTALQKTQKNIGHTNNGKAVHGGSKVILGKQFTGSPIKINEITIDTEKAIIEGEVFYVEHRTLNSGKTMIILNITDFSNSITLKIFEGKNQSTPLKDLVSKGQYIKAKGDIVYDKYLKENIIIASDLLLLSKEERKDLEETKRVELHLHTQMSSMDGISNTSDLIQLASKWGHKAIAITDHGVVQAFPEAMEASKKYGIKVIYGMEGYIVNDEEKLIEISNDSYSLEDEYIVFDIETTGLSNATDKITEIGAIKIRNRQVIDKFSSLINPKIPIPEKITQITGINNEMVENAPTIEEVLPKFLDFIGTSCVVAHNAAFDVGFIRVNANELGHEFINPVVDTLKLSRILLSHLKRHKLNTIAKELNVTLENHHRAVDDAKATAEIFMKFIDLMKDKDIHTLQDINQFLGKKVDFKKLDTYHIILLAKNEIGLKNLYKIVSESHLKYFYKKPRIPKSLLNHYREGIIIGSACEGGELFQALLNNLPGEMIEQIAKYYDYLEIQPLENNEFLVEKGILNSFEDVKKINTRIIELGEEFDIPVVATGDVHFLHQHDEYCRRILMAGQGYSDADKQAPLYFKTTHEMLHEFSYLGESTAKKVVVDNPNVINEMIDELLPIPDGTFPPEIEGSEEELRKLCYGKASKIYGEPLPIIVKNRLDKEVNAIINNGYAVMYIIAQKLVTKSLEDGYLVGSRGSVGSSFAATMSDITEVNPLPPHYVCAECKYSEFITDGSYGSGADLPDKKCPECHHQLTKEGHDIPFEVFLGFEGDKEPDIDLNFAGEYQSEAHKYTEELFGEGKVFRAGTIGTIADKTAYGFVKKYLEGKQMDYTQAEVNRLTIGCTGVKRTSGQHPGGVMIVPSNRDIHEFCPIQYPANDPSTGVIITHFDYHAISGRLLKLDILGHDVPTIIKMLEDITQINAQMISLDDEKTMSIFTTTKELNINTQDFKCQVGTLGIPEFGTKFVRQMLVDTQPKTFAELVRISGLSHGTDVWLNNAQELVRNNTAELKDVISTRDDIMNYLILKGVPAKNAFKIMENVRKGKGLTPEDEELMRDNNVSQWYIASCNKIKYMFPKAHAVAYVMMSFRIAYFKVHFPEAFYATYFTMKADDFDADLISKGKEVVKNKIIELENLGNNIAEKMTAKEKNLLTVLEVALEMYYRNIELLPVDIYKSDADKFIIIDNKLLPPLKSLQGVGQNAAKSIVTARKNGEFLSLEDLRERTRVTKTVIETLVKHGCIDDLPNTNQLSLF